MTYTFSTVRYLELAMVNLTILCFLCYTILDENPKNNDVSNLEWSTPYLNSNYGTRNKRIGITLSKSVIMLDKETKQPLKRFGSVADAAGG